MSIGRISDLIAKWNAYKASVSEPDRYCEIRVNLKKARNPDFEGNPPISFWPRHLIDSDDDVMAAVEHYFLCRCWVGSGKYSQDQMRTMNVIYDLGKAYGASPRYNPNKPTTQLTPWQIYFQELGIRDGTSDLAKSGKSAPLIAMPPKY